MIEQILNLYQNSNYDFRVYACPDDPLSDNFKEWVDYYRMKWAVSKAIMPKSILEMGGYYGYSSRAFLDSTPKAKLTAVDLDIASLDWAKKSLQKEGFDIAMFSSGSQQLKQFKGDIYDLIHISRQQEGDRVFHYLDQAVTQARYILVDGYLGTRDDFLAINEWVWLNRQVIEVASIIPGYSGEFLIKTKLSLSASAGFEINSSDAIASAYTKDYYLGDCGGWREWQKDQHTLSDPRLNAVGQVGLALGIPAKVVDLGAGRGELTSFFAQKGSEVTAIDYSSDAVALINASLSNQAEIKNRVTVTCSSVLSPEAYSSSQYNLAVASDIIEHLLPEENDKLYRLVSEKLKLNAGALVVHTAPNLWNYRYEHVLQQKAARQAGFWLPRTRRTWYERVMHINEQNPRVLKQQLSSHFPYVLLWFADDRTMGGSLLRKFSVSDFRQSQSLFAIASHRPIDKEKIANVFCMNALNVEEAEGISVLLKQCPSFIQPGMQFRVPVKVTNATDQILKSQLPHPFHLSYHWLDEFGTVQIFEGLRTPLLSPLNPGEQTDILVTITAPENPGNYFLSVLVVQEGVRWITETACTSKGITVAPSASMNQFEPDSVEMD